MKVEVIADIHCFATLQGDHVVPLLPFETFVIC